MKTVKNLMSPVKEPFWKHRAAGLRAYHFDEADALQFRCSYVNALGKLEFPYIYQVDCKKAKEFFPKFADLILCPFDQCEVIGDNTQDIPVKKVAIPVQKKIDPIVKKDLFGKPLTDFQ